MMMEPFDGWDGIGKTEPVKEDEVKDAYTSKPE